MRFDKLFQVMKKSGGLKICNVCGGQMYVFDGAAAYIFRDVPEIVQPGDLFSIWGIDSSDRNKYDIDVGGQSNGDFDNITSGIAQGNSTPVKILDNLSVWGFSAVLLGQDETQLTFGPGDEDIGMIPVRPYLLNVLSPNTCFEYVRAEEEAPGRIAAYEDGELCAVFYPMRLRGDLYSRICRIVDGVGRFKTDE